jgi:hypothetical protein
VKTSNLTSLLLFCSHSPRLGRYSDASQLCLIAVLRLHYRPAGTAHEGAAALGMDETSRTHGYGIQTLLIFFSYIPGDLAVLVTRTSWIDYANPDKTQTKTAPKTGRGQPLG